MLLYDQLFWHTGHFETNALNDPKITLNTTRSKILHVLLVSLSHKFHSVLLYDPSFQDIAHFIISHWQYHVKQQNTKNQKKKKKCRKFKISNVTILLTALVRDSPQKYTWILGKKSDIFLQRTCHLKLLLPDGPMLTKMKKKLAKIQNLKFHNSLNKFSRDPP